ncbi:putative membrane protein, partial [Ehrlichia ruminantium]
MKYKSKELDISDNGTKSRVTYCSQSEYEYGKCEMDTSSGKDGIEFLKSVYHNDSDDVGHVLKSRSTVSSTKVDQVKHQVSSVQTIEHDSAIEGQQVIGKDTGIGVHYSHTEITMKTSLSFKSDVMVDTKDKSIEKKIVLEDNTIRINEKKRDIFVSASAQTDMKSNQVKLSSSVLEKPDEKKDVTDTGCTGSTKDKSIEEKVVPEDTAIRDKKEISVARSVGATFNLQSGNVKGDKVKLSGVDLGKIEDSVLSASSCETTVKDNKPVICVGEESTFQLASSLDLVNTVQDSSRNTRGLSETCSLVLDFDRNGNPIYEEATSKLVPSFYSDNIIYHTKEKHCGVDIPQSEDQLCSCITNAHSQCSVTENSVSVCQSDLVHDGEQSEQNEGTKQGAFIATGSVSAKLDITDVVNLGEKCDIDEKVVKSSDCATADSV